MVHGSQCTIHSRGDCVLVALVIPLHFKCPFHTILVHRHSRPSIKTSHSHTFEKRSLSLLVNPPDGFGGGGCGLFCGTAGAWKVLLSHPPKSSSAATLEGFAEGCVEPLKLVLLLVLLPPPFQPQSAVGIERAAVALVDFIGGVGRLDVVVVGPAEAHASLDPHGSMFSIDEGLFDCMLGCVTGLVGETGFERLKGELMF